MLYPVSPCVSFSCISSFVSLHFLPFVFLPFSPSSSPSHSLWTWGEKDIVEYCFTLLTGEMKWECLSLLFLSLYLSWEDLPNRPQFPRPLYNCSTIHPIVQLFFCVSLDSSSLCLFVRHEGDTKKYLASHRLIPPPLFSPLSFFSLDPSLFWASSVSDVFTRCCIEQF